eukprot:TRINITY_DN20734_c0_g1_i1.p1 TRINITY_DN20734_c0_g1~~TRINITY_DN20734_c0_g1_i1.p1  ORF type:complete len:932 (-),score=412.79 TRINITY_DN20734_c0_g1_i1:126-2921(-)
MAEEPCTILVHHDAGDPPNIQALKQTLEKGTEEEKVKAFKTVLMLMINGDEVPGILMTVIRFVLPHKHHMLKKLLLIFWEVCPKKGPDGKLLSEMILVCNAIRNDLIHPNEYIRGSTLRYICKLKEMEVLEPLMPSVLKNLEHRHSYVRRNAVNAIFAVYKDFEVLCPDAPQIIYEFLLNEGDPACKRNAFLMLYNCAQERALDYLNEVIDKVSTFGDILQFAAINLIKKVCRGPLSASERSRYIRCIISLLSAASPGVQYDAAGALYALSSSPTAIKAATSTYIDLLCNQSDNNVKLIILDRLAVIKKENSKVIGELLMDVLRALASPTLDIRKKTLDFAMDLVTPRNIDEVILLLKKEINRTQSAEMDKAAEYRQVLIHAIHSCAVKFPDVASNVVHVLLDFVGDSSVASAVDVVVFVREVMETYPQLRDTILEKLVDSLDTINASQVYRAVLWLLGEYAVDEKQVDAAFTALKRTLGPLPLEAPLEQQDKPAPEQVAVTVNKVLADGTYATQTSYTTTGSKTEEASALRSLVVAKDFFLASTLSSTLTKLVLKLRSMDVPAVVKNSVSAEALLIMVSLYRLGQNGGIHEDADSEERIRLCIHILTSRDNGEAEQLLLVECRRSFAKMLLEQKEQEEGTKKVATVQAQADDLIEVRQLRSGIQFGTGDSKEDDDISLATGDSDRSEAGESKLNRVYQLTGFSDPIYAEAYVSVHRYDIVLDVMVINRTKDTLQNLCLELATLGDLKLCERPQNYTIGPKTKRWIKANIKVSSTETGIIFGNIVYDVAGSASGDQNCIVLSDIHVDIMDYITPAFTTDAKYRSMWAEFEWENKVTINSSINDLNDFLNHIVKSTNMRCLTPQSSLQGECGFLAANLYAKSIFGEDALANVSVEKIENRIAGYIRIRSKTQGIALSLGDKITLKQACKDEQ